MSGVMWHTRAGEVRLAGAERAHLNIMVRDLAESVVHTQHFRGDMHPIGNLLPPEDQSQLRRSSWNDPATAALRINQQIGYILGGFMDKPLTFGGETHDSGNLVANTAVATGSPLLALAAKLHFYCESHAWVDEPNRAWLADVIEQGRKVNVFRADVGWEDVVEFLRQTELFPGPVVTSYTVCDAFPSMAACDWMDPAWPEPMVESGDYDYEALTDEQKVRVGDRQEAWYDLTTDEQWDLTLPYLKTNWWLELSPDTLTNPTFAGTTSLWDAVASEEWRL